MNICISLRNQRRFLAHTKGRQDMTNQLQTQNKRDISTDTSAWTFQDIKRYYDPQDLLTEKQVGQALSLIKGRNLNPLLNEVYIVAYKKKMVGLNLA